MKKKLGTLKHKSSDIIDNTVKNATNQPVPLDNEVTPDVAVFSVADSAGTVAAAADSFIAPDAYFLSSGLKLDTELFLTGSINNMADKYKIYPTPGPNVPESDTPNSSAQDYGPLTPNSLYPLRNRKFAPYSTNTMKNQKKRENKIDDKVTN